MSGLGFGPGLDRDDRNANIRDDLGPDLRDPDEAAVEDRMVDNTVAAEYRVPRREPGPEAPDPASEEEQFASYMKANFPQPGVRR